MKRLVLSAVALSMLALPVAQAQSAPMQNMKVERQQTNEWNKRPGGPDRFHAKPSQKKHVQHWKKGQRVPDWKRKQAVRDYHRHGLRKPGFGRQWVRVGNEYLLISLFSGIIAGLIAAQ